MPDVRRLPTRPGISTMFWRAIRLRCPRCGEGALFTAPFTMREACPTCGLRFEREQGYFVGAIYVNYAVTAAACLGGPIALDLAFGLPVGAQLAVAAVLAVLVPLVFFRYSRSFWLSIDHLVTSADDAIEYRTRRPQ